MRVAPPDWSGETVVCIASGPSLTAEDVELVRGHKTIVVNTSFRLAPWADILFAHDMRWWREYGAEVDKVFTGRKMSLHHKGVEALYNCGWLPQSGNSGGCAIQIAVAAKAAKVILLGYDCQKKGQVVHWHGNHPKGMSNGLSIGAWPAQFAKVASYAKQKGVRVINASRETALTCFERAPLEGLL